MFESKYLTAEDILFNSNACLPVWVYFHHGYQHNLQTLIFKKFLVRCSLTVAQKELCYM